MKKSFIIFTFVLFNSIFWATTLNAQIPQIINWQGIIQDANGNNLNGQYSLNIKIFDVQTGGTSLWNETHNNLLIENGLANIVLGSVTPINLPFDKQYWLEITVGTGTPLPRIKLSSVPYSLYSKKSSGVIENDSLVLKDANGVTRMILNPNTGTFKMMNNDTVWYEMNVQSPKEEKIELWDGITVEKSYKKGIGLDQYEIKKKDADGNIFFNEKGSHFSVGGETVDKSEKVYYTKNPDGSYFMSQKTFSTDYSNVYELNDNIWWTTKELVQINYNENGNIVSKKITNSDMKLENNRHSYETKSNTNERYDANGNFLGKTVAKEINYNDLASHNSFKQDIFEIYDGNTLINRRTTSYKKDGISEILTENFDKNGNKISEFEEIENANTGIITKKVKKDDKSTSFDQTSELFKFSNSGSNNSLQIKENSYLGHFDVNLYIGGNEKRVFKADQNYVYFGPNDNIKSNQDGTTLSGSVTNSGQTQFQGNTYHNGTNYFSGNVYGGFSKWNSGVEIGANTSNPGFLYCRGPAEINGEATINNNTEINGNLSVDGDFSVNGNLNLSQANGTFNNVKSNNEIQAKGPKKFVIDHPSDNTKLIQHAAIESNKVYNTYFGKVITNNSGLATVTLPNYFPLINYTNEEYIYYNLTVISQTNVQAYIFSEYDEDTNSFVIKTSSPLIQVSWQVTAIRNDNYMQNHPFNDVINK